MYKSFAVSLGLLGLLLSSPAQTVDAAELRVHGSSTVFQTVMQPNRSVIEQRASQNLQLLSVGSGNGVISLLAGKADVAMISAPLPDVVTKLNRKKPGSVDGSRLVAHPIGQTRIAFAVNPLNPVRELSFAQITDILIGKITNWQEVGGNNAPIDIIAELRGGGVRTVVEKVLSKAGAGELANPRTVQSAGMAAFAVSKIPNGLAVTTVAAIDNQSRFMVRTDQQIGQPMFLVTQDQPDMAAQTLINAVRDVNGWTPEPPKQAEPKADAPAGEQVSSVQPSAAAAGS